MVKENIFPTCRIYPPPPSSKGSMAGLYACNVSSIACSLYSSPVCLHKMPGGSKYSLLKSELEVQVMMATNLQTPRLFSMYIYEDINCDTSLMLKMANLIFILTSSHERFFLGDLSVCFRHFFPIRRKFCSTDLNLFFNTNGVRSDTYFYL